MAERKTSTRKTSGARRPGGGGTAAAPSVPKAVGASLRAWRHESGLSIREVAKLSGLSMSFVSLVERGETEIALTRLIRLTDVFGRHVSDVMKGVDDPARQSSPKVEADEGLQIRVHTLASGVEMVYMGEPSWRMQPFVIALEPGSVHGPVSHSYEELVVCLDGVATMVLDGSLVSLQPGEVMYVEPEMHHAYGNAGTTRARLLAVDLRSDDVRTVLRTWAQLHRSMGPRGAGAGEPAAGGDAPAEDAPGSAPAAGPPPAARPSATRG